MRIDFSSLGGASQASLQIRTAELRGPELALAHRRIISCSTTLTRTCTVASVQLVLDNRMYLLAKIDLSKRHRRMKCLAGDS